jgi:hypothetical protein
MPTYKGAYSKDDKECNTGVGLDRDSYNPGRKPNVYVSNAKGKNSIDLSKQLDNTDVGYERNTDQLTRAGFSGPVSRNK